MSVQAISGSTLQPYQPIQQTAQNDSQTSQPSSGQKVKKGGGHHHHAQPQEAGNPQGTAATSATSTPQTAGAVTGGASR